MYDIGYKILLTSALFFVIFLLVGLLATSKPRQPKVVDTCASVVTVCFFGIIAGFLMMIWGR